MRVSSNMSSMSLEAAPSAARATGTPAGSIRGTGAMPLPSFRLLFGQCTTVAPLPASSPISSSVTWTQCTALVPGRSNPSCAA